MPREDSFEKTSLNQIKRVAKRGHYDRETVHRVFDEAWICHVGFMGESFPTVIPMFHVRVGDEIILHGATTSRLMIHLASGAPVCLSTAMVDGLVLARSLFHHSMNYRSAIAFGSGRLIDDPDEMTMAFKALADKVMSGRWEDARQPSEKELKATALVAIRMDSASAKIREGGPVDDPEDLNLPVWAGVIPIREQLGAMESAADLRSDVSPPQYLQTFYQSRD